MGELERKKEGWREKVGGRKRGRDVETEGERGGDIGRERENRKVNGLKQNGR